MTSLATCSFYEFRPDMGQPVRISLGVPKFRLSWRLPSVRLEELTPRGWYFRAPPEVFARKFLEQLDQVGVDRLRGIFEDTLEGDGPLVLLCFERDVRSGNDCHRRRFADWWQKNTGEFVPELGGKYASNREES